MFDSIYIGMSGLEGFSKGLKVISNNVANLNTPGFKSSNLQFTDAYYQQGTLSGSQSGNPAPQYGTGLNTLTSTVNFQTGELRQTGNPLDVNISGEGFLVVQDKDSQEQHYTRDGQLQFDKDGNLVSRTSGKYVLGYAADAQGSALSRISLNGLRSNPAKATATVKFSGNLSSGTDESTVDGVKLIDALGGEHTVSLKFKKKGDSAPNAWTVTVSEGTTTVGSGDISFTDGKPNAAANSVSITYTPTGGAPAFPVKLDFSGDVTSFASGNLTSLAVNSQDGYAAGAISKAEFDAEGKLSLTYTNGQTAKGNQLALAFFDSKQSLTEAGGGEFASSDAQAARLGRPGSTGFGSIGSNQLELSNVDLSSEFSNLIVMQRGYQASSRIVSTANDMLQELFDMKGRG